MPANDHTTTDDDRDHTPATAVALDDASAPDDAAARAVAPDDATTGAGPAGASATAGVPDLHFAYTSTRPDLSDVDVKATLRVTFLGADCTFAVIGSSHFVAAPGLDYHELCSCEPVPVADADRVPLAPGVDRRFTHETDRLRVETTVEGRPLAAFPGPDDADLHWRFGPDAYTTITLGADRYETYHTYPEYDLALYTDSRFTAMATPDRPATDRDRTDTLQESDT